MQTRPFDPVTKTPIRAAACPVITRRCFLAATGQALLASLPAYAAAPTPRPCPPSQWHKQGEILKDARQNGKLQCFTCPAEPLGDGSWRLWHSISGHGVRKNLAVAEGPLDGKMVCHEAVLSEGEPPDAPLAIGNLPAGWQPVQGVHLRLPTGRHRLYFWAHGPRIVRYLVAESDDGRRYRVLDPLRPCLYHPSDRAVTGEAAAEAGLKRLAGKKADRPGEEPAAPARLISNDATNVYQLGDGSFEMYSVALVEVIRGDPRYIAHDNAAGWVRVIDRYTSGDGLHWGDRRRVLVPDDKDPADQQFYYLAVTHTPKGRVGMLGHYRVEAQTMDLEWCFSEDGIVWQRPLRTPWIARGEPGQPDSYGIYGSHNLVQQGGRWHLLYTGVNSAHNGKHSHGPPRQSILWATCDSIWG